MTVGLSGGFIALTARLSLWTLRDACNQLAGRIMVALGLSLAALEATTGPPGATLSARLWAPLRVVGGLNVGLLWLFCLALLRDKARLGHFAWIDLVLLSVGPIETMVD